MLLVLLLLVLLFLIFLTKKNLIAVVLATAVLMSGGLSVAAEESGDVDDLVAFLTSLTGGDVGALVADAFAAPVGEAE